MILSSGGNRGDSRGIGGDIMGDRGGSRVQGSALWLLKNLRLGFGLGLGLGLGLELELGLGFRL